jgi:hypothetical protein
MKVLHKFRGEKERCGEWWERARERGRMRETQGGRRKTHPIREKVGTPPIRRQNFRCIYFFM